MIDPHLTPFQIDQYDDNQMDAPARVAVDQHLGACAACRARLAASQRLDAALRTLPRETPPPGLGDLIATAVEWRAGQEQQRRARMPLVALATFFSLLLTLWFSAEVVIAVQENGVLDFLALFTAHSEISYSTDALLALIEAMPYTEIALTLFALVTAIALAANLVDAIRPRALGWNRNS